ncbi:hypothetical protein EDC04DRAFT_2601277 [Pisolithus marmoratus]|nr:hypothetical protein EDC04DRAFT_2601277 [Pisolithus marmoratus]
MFHIDPEEHASKKVQSPVKNICPPRPEGESSHTKKWMLGTSTSHLAMNPPQSRRHTKSQNDFVREWLPWRAEYLNVILEGEQLAKAGILNLPFQNVQRWNGTHYECTSSMELGFLWHIGHGGDPCPQNSSDPDPDESGYMTGEEPPNHRQRLFPASISKPKTAFTFAVLDHFLIDALECKTSAMSFYQKLKRFTNNAFPERDRYRELMKNGLALGMIWSRILGMEDLPSSAQLDVNLPADWKVCYDRDIIMRQYVIDGNFTAQHMKMNKPELDVALSDGKGYMVAEIFRKGRESITKALVIYDVGCQWSINFRSRVKNSPSFLLPPALEIVPAVGKFHLAAHKLSCFPRYSLNFIKGAGHLDGEILETLWAPFNKISPTARSMTQAHRQEVYDDHMRDSNWKKLVGMGKFFFSWRGCKFMPNITVPSLLKKYKNSIKCLEEMNQAYEQLTAVLDPDKVSRWESDALRAEADRGEALDIYLLKGDKAHTFQEVWLQLMKNPKSPSGNAGSVAWLAEGISIEDSQFGYRWGFHSPDDPAFCGSDEEEHEDREFWDDDEGDWEAPEEEVEGLASELMNIWMPSSIGAVRLTELGLHDLLKEERELRIGQANDYLDQLRTDLGNKAMTANSTREGTRTKKEIQKVVARVNKHVRSYQRARQAILRLDPDGNMAEKYQEILPEDLAVSKEVTEENRFGQGTSKLAWFWVIDVYRINWLKARARRDRWKEEVSLVRHEMLWTGLWLEYHKKMWEKRALQLTEPGKEGYAKKQMGLWSDFASKARLMFHGLGGRTGVNGKYVQTKLAMPKSRMADILSTTGLNKERRDTKGPKTIGQRNRIIQQWWESVSDERKAEAGRAVEKWNKLAHEAGEGQIKIAVFETAPGDGKKAFTQSSESSKDWVLNGENSLMDYLLTAPVEEDSAEKHEVEISLDEDGNPEMPTWSGQKLKVQQNLARAVFQAAYVWGIAKFMKKPKAKVPWGLLIKSPMEYLDSWSILEGFMMKDPSKWTKANLGLLWDHWQTLEAEEKVIVSFIGCKKEDAPLSRQFDRRPVAGSSKKREWMDPEDDSEEEVGEAGVHLGQMMKSGEVVNKGAEVTMDVRDQAPEESSPAWHASKDCIQYLKSLSIMPRYQVLVGLVEALPEEVRTWKGERGSPFQLGNMNLEYQVFAPGNPFGVCLFLEGPWGITKCKVHFLLIGWGGGTGTCHAQEVEEDDPLTSDFEVLSCLSLLAARPHLKNFLLNSELGIQKAENVMDIVGLIVARLEQSSGMKEPQEGDEGAGMGGTDREDEEKEEEEVAPVVPTQKWKGAESGIVTRGKKVAKQDAEKDKEGGENGKRGVRTWNQTRRAMGL